MSAKWTAADVPDQTGRVAIITGANTGIGFGAAAVLAEKGAHMVLAVRNLDKGNDAVGRIKAASPNAVVTVQELDLTSLDNIRKAADKLRADFPRIDLLINNAGVMYTDKASTKDGFELQFGTNHLGHFALTGLLLDKCCASTARGWSRSAASATGSAPKFISTTSIWITTTTGSSHTASPNWPTCCSPTSWHAG